MALKPAIHRPFRPPSFKPWKPPKPTLKPGQGYLSPGQRKGLAGLKPGQLGASIMGDIGQWANNWNANQGQQQQQGNAYQNLIGGDWGVQEMESQMNARLGRARGDFQSQLRQSLVDLGVVDQAKLGGLGQYIDADTIKKAAENKYSMTARIAQAETQKKSQSEAALAARGILSSGQTTRERTGILAEGENQRYDALRSFLSGGAQGLAGIADLNDQLAGQLAQSRFDAAGRAASTYGMGLGEGTEPYAGPSLAPVTKPTVKKVVKKPVVRKPPPRPKKKPVRRGGGGSTYRSM